jgi:hypothetical protein
MCDQFRFRPTYLLRPIAEDTQAPKVNVLNHTRPGCHQRFRLITGDPEDPQLVTEPLLQAIKDREAYPKPGIRIDVIDCLSRYRRDAAPVQACIVHRPKHCGKDKRH